MWICKYAAAHALIGLLGNDICANAVVADFDIGTLKDESTPFTAGVEVGRISSDPIKEASGLASSRVNANVLYTHNDRGDDARIFAIRSDGKHVATLNLKSALHVDYEDIAVGPGPLTDTSYIYVGDIGNNLYKDEPRDNIVIYRLTEPDIDADFDASRSINVDVDALTLAYPNDAHDAETLLIDPFDSSLYVITKRNGDNYIYRTSQAWGAGDASQMLEYAGRMQSADDATGGDISVDGTEILIKNIREMVYFTREDDPSSFDLASVLREKGETLPYEREAQGESVTFVVDGRGYLTLSESKSKSSVPLMFYARNNIGIFEPTSIPTSSPTKAPNVSTIGKARIIDATVMRRRIWLHLDGGDIDPIQAARIDNYALYDKDKEQPVAISKAQYLPPKNESSPRILLLLSHFNKNDLLDVGVSRDFIDASMVEADVQPGYASVISVLSGRKAEIRESDGDVMNFQITSLGLINCVKRSADNHLKLTISRTSKELYESTLIGSVSPSPSGDGIVQIDSLSIERTITFLVDPEHFVIGPLSASDKERLQERSNGTITDVLL